MRLQLLLKCDQHTFKATFDCTYSLFLSSFACTHTFEPMAEYGLRFLPSLTCGDHEGGRKGKNGRGRSEKDFRALRKPGL